MNLRYGTAVGIELLFQRSAHGLGGVSAPQRMRERPVDQTSALIEVKGTESEEQRRSPPTPPRRPADPAAARL